MASALKSPVKASLAVLGVAVLAGGGLWLARRAEREPPAINLAGEPRALGRVSQLKFEVQDARSGLRQVRAWAKQGERTVPLLSEDYPAGGFLGGGTVHRKEFDVPLDARALGFAEGPVTLVVAAQDHSLWALKGNSVFREVRAVVDTQPPRLDLLSTVHHVNRGGTGLVAYRLGEAAARSGVEVAGLFFPGYPEKAGGAGAHVAYFAYPHDAPAGAAVSLMAVDPAGNESRRAVPVILHEKPLPADTMEVSDSFLAMKIPEFRAAAPTLPADPLQAYLEVNRGWRARDHARLLELCASSAPERLWAGPFLQMPNTKNMAPYAVRRTYRHRGAVVDHQTHLGIDLASTAGAPVPAADRGKVAFAGDLGIYGQAVLLDHGQGVFSLYGHLSRIDVKAGDEAARGAAVGGSGMTGVAGGDHLHFSVLVSGAFVNPAEWLDAHWIADNVQTKLASFGAPPPAP